MALSECKEKQKQAFDTIVDRVVRSVLAALDEPVTMAVKHLKSSTKDFVQLQASKKLEELVAALQPLAHRCQELDKMIPTSESLGLQVCRM